jgi:hypothetical protein
VEEDWQALSQLCGGGQRLAAAVAAETSLTAVGER